MRKGNTPFSTLQGISLICAMVEFMQRAIELAEHGKGMVAPNPMVGCVIEHEGKIIGEGWHRAFGGPHAEVNAIASVQNPELLSQSTVYVTLEPCSHFGKTPPCANLLIAHKVKKVVISTLDPNPLVAGNGMRFIQEAGIEVDLGMLASDARFLNRRFFTHHEKKRPYIILKWAQSADGFIDHERSDSEQGSFRISGNDARRMTHRWRTEEQSILVGKTTASHDQPQLTARYWTGKNPIRILIDPNLEIQGTNPIFSEGIRTLVFNRLETRTIFNVERIQLDFNQSIIPNILAYLHYEGIQSVIVEGGAATHARFLDAGLWDEVRRFSSKSLILEKGLKAFDFREKAQERLELEQDILEVFYTINA